jgi:hypothetical protein
VPYIIEIVSLLLPINFNVDNCLLKEWLPGIPRSKWENNVEMDITGVNYEDGRRMELARVMSNDELWY